MPRRSYTVKSGDTLDNIARVFYGSANESGRIVENNGLLKFRRRHKVTTRNGKPSVFEGDVLVLVVDSNFLVKPQNVEPDVFTLYLNQDKVSIPDGSEFTQYYDACCSTFGATFPWDTYNRAHRRWWGNPLDLAECTLYGGDEQVFGGKFENSKNTSDPDSLSMEVSARSHTRILQKTALPSMQYPVEREKETLEQIAQWGTNVWGFYAESDNPTSEAFDKVAIKKDQKFYAWLADLANIEGRVLSSTNDGYGLVIRSPLQVAEAVGYYAEGKAGFTPPEFEFDTNKLHGNYIGTSKGARRAGNTSNYRDPNFAEQTYSHLDLQGTKKGRLGESVEYAARKVYRDFFTTDFDPGGGFLNPQGKLWAPGQYLTLRAPTSRIYKDTLFLVRSVKFHLGADSQRVTLGIVPPWVYAALGTGADEQAKSLAMWSDDYLYSFGDV